MFTVRHDVDGTSRFYTAARVDRVGPHANIGPEGVHMLCGPDEARAGIDAKSLYGGEVYIMNEQGATVGKFILPSNPSTKGAVSNAA